LRPDRSDDDQYVEQDDDANEGEEHDYDVNEGGNGDLLSIPWKEAVCIALLHG